MWPFRALKSGFVLENRFSTAPGNANDCLSFQEGAGFTGMCGIVSFIRMLGILLIYLQLLSCNNSKSNVLSVLIQKIWTMLSTFYHQTHHILQWKANRKKWGAAAGLISAGTQNLAQLLPCKRPLTSHWISQQESNWGIGWLEKNNSIGGGGRGNNDSLALLSLYSRQNWDHCKIAARPERHSGSPGMACWSQHSGGVRKVEV